MDKINREDIRILYRGCFISADAFEKLMLEEEVDFRAEGRSLVDWGMTHKKYRMLKDKDTGLSYIHGEKR